MKVAALCAGYGGLELGLTEAGVDSTLEWFSEIDDDAAQVMKHRFDAPNLGDLTMIDDPPPVDMITAGFPCQPVSQAGQRKGVTDERWLIRDICQLARRAQADWLFLENVPGLRTASGGHAMAHVVSGLAEIGFDAEWLHLRASDIGACHIRERWFCLAWSPDASMRPRLGDHKRGTPSPALAQARWDDGRRNLDDAVVTLPTPNAWDGARGPDTARADRPDSGGNDLVTVATKLLPTPTSSDAKGSQRVDNWPSSSDGVSVTDAVVRFGEEYGPAIARWEHILGRPAPDPTIPTRSKLGRNLNHRFVEWMMGLPVGWVTDPVERRTTALRLLGNGVVPQQSALAFRLLTEQAHRHGAGYMVKWSSDLSESKA